MYRTRPRGGEWREVDELVPIVTTPMHFGGVRHWFRCPSCRRRCRIIYGGALFQCRLCVGARYESQYEALPIRISGQRWKIRRRLEERGGKPWPFGLDDGFPEKPPRMHWKTYKRLCQRDQQLGSTWTATVGAWLKRHRLP